MWNLLVLTPLVGINWIFGILSLAFREPEPALALLYLFVIFAGLQVMYVVCDIVLPQTMLEFSLQHGLFLIIYQP